MPFRRSSKMAGGVSLWLAILALMTGSAFAAIPKSAKDLGPEDQNKQITVTVWLKQHNKAALDALVKQMYDKASPNYHHFLTLGQYQARFAPTAKEAAVVRDFLRTHNLSVTSIDKLNHYVTAQGRIGDVQTAFNTQINRIMLNSGAMHRANVSEAKIEGTASALVSAVQGLNDFGYEPHVKTAHNFATGAPYPPVALSAGPDGLFFSQQCLFPPTTETFNTSGTFPEATYFGNIYGAPITNGPPNLAPCGYDAAEFETAYGLPPLYAKGLNGTGQTIAIVDAFGSNTILTDANTYSALNGLPALTTGTGGNFQIYTPEGPVSCTPTNGCVKGNWYIETSLDVESAHAIAPGADIALVETVDNHLTSLDLGNLFAIEENLGNVISNSFGQSEVALAELDPSELVLENSIAEMAAGVGISLDVSSGDFGDFLAVDEAEFGIDSVSVSANADSPFATGVGGTSTFLDSHNHIELQTGWGLNATAIVNKGAPLDPPVPLGFLEGAGGGVSVVYSKPAFQKHLPGNFRLVPDIAMDADPQTGAELIITPDSIAGGEQFVFLVGGTSLSAPMFSGIWAIANQAAGSAAPLGQAAPTLYDLPFFAINDVNLNPFDTLFNAFGLVSSSPTSTTFESPAALGTPEPPTRLFVSALIQLSPTAWDVLTFGTDSSLATGPGWDDVTGLGTPNGEAFIQAVVESAH
jgi:subtilase family serine protease